MRLANGLSVLVEKRTRGDCYGLQAQQLTRSGGGAKADPPKECWPKIIYELHKSAGDWWLGAYMGFVSNGSKPWNRFLLALLLLGLRWGVTGAHYDVETSTYGS